MRLSSTLAPLAAAAFTGAAGFAQPTAAQPAVGQTTVEGDLVDINGARIGDVRVQETGQGLLIKVHARGLPPGSHGMHLHQIADCSDPPMFEAAGDHIAMEGQVHGFLNEAGPHTGDLPNLIVGDDGVITAELETARLPLRGAHGPLLDRDGAALIIHAHEDDHAGEDGGGSGDRIACAALESPSSTDAPSE